VTRSAGGPRTGERPRWRDVDGVVLLDKPAGPGSTTVLQHVRRLLQAAKAGHAGTLDPMASGMLPLCFGQATKACGVLLGSAKAYRARLRLGAATDTGDAEGNVVRAATVPVLDPSRVATVLAAMVGPQLQRPPMYSALKHQGRPLYELARRGEEVERQPRPVTIHRLQLLDLQEEALEVEVVCSKGTYVRVLGEEIATGLGTVGHLVGLRRLWVEPFDPAAMVSLETVESWAAGQPPEGERPPWLLPTDAALVSLPRLDLDDLQTRHLCQGRTVVVGPERPSGPSRAYDASGRFLGLVEPAPGDAVRVVRLFVPGSTGPPSAPA
jgi:tRNA pseudouridine55 synthase